MKKSNIKEAKRFAQQFISAVNEYEKARDEHGGKTYYVCCPKESGHLRRMSMELTRSLAKMRNEK